MSAGSNARGSRAGRTARRLARLLPLAVAVLTLPAGADSLGLAAVPLPPDTSRASIATDILQDGRLTSIASLEGGASVDELLTFYREAWPASGDDPGHLEERLGEWSVVSRVQDSSLLVVQLRDAPSGAEGLLSAMALGPVQAGPVPPPPMPAGGELLSSTSARDGASVATTSVVLSSARPGEVAAFYRDRLVRDGWTLVSDRMHGGSPVLLLDRRGGRVEIVVTDAAGRSVVVVNEVRRDG